MPTKTSLLTAHNYTVQINLARTLGERDFE